LNLHEAAEVVMPHDMYTVIALAWFGLALVWAAVFAYRRLAAAVPALFTFRGQRLVTCPENGRAVGVEVDARHAAATTLQGRPELRLHACSRWPEKAGCGQECLRQIEAAPEECLVRRILTRWYEGKACVYCHRAFGTIHWHDYKPTLLAPDGRTVEWRELPVEQIPAALALDKPVCWNCHIAETFRREHPDLVVDRPWQGVEREGRAALRPH
jgi:hypothetical protein